MIQQDVQQQVVTYLKNHSKHNYAAHLLTQALVVTYLKNHSKHNRNKIIPWFLMISMY